MHSTAPHRRTRLCLIYLHPAVATSPENVRRVEDATNKVVSIIDGKALLQQRHVLPAFEDFSGFDGGAA
ncbi:hypothetical protein [Pseudomonas sp. LFM046]|uniref:hypothetical protein n=1 Tax=Pseudomonas sp. LFM046 TaxID=1608357 RepID=UPI0005CFB0F1|nr:hypothetical protein [Pseudomonas sp. LFM046]